MSPLIFETIRWSKGRPEALSWHQRRLELSLRQLNPQASLPKLADWLRLHPGPDDDAVYKYHVSCDLEGQLQSPHYDLYHPRSINRLLCVEESELSYSVKWEDRQAFQELANRPELKPILQSDDELIIVQHGNVTDTRYSNLAFWDGKVWVTPTSYLLPGTRRARLIAAGVLQERPITVQDLPNYQSACLINAMLDLGEVTCSTIIC